LGAKQEMENNTPKFHHNPWDNYKSRSGFTNRSELDIVSLINQPAAILHGRMVEVLVEWINYFRLSVVVRLDAMRHYV